MKYICTLCFFLLLHQLPAQTARQNAYRQRCDRLSLQTAQAIDKQPMIQKLFADSVGDTIRGVATMPAARLRATLLTKVYTKGSACALMEWFFEKNGQVYLYISRESCEVFSEKTNTEDRYYFKNKQLLLHTRQRKGYSNPRQQQTENIPPKEGEAGYILADYAWWRGFLLSAKDYDTYINE